MQRMVKVPAARTVTTGRRMREVPPDEWPRTPNLEAFPLGVWLSSDYLAVLWEQRADGNKRLSVNRTRRDGRSWRDGITWDELQRVKNECLGEDAWCVEVYPAQDALVNASNIRHLWVLDGPPDTRFPEEAVFDDRMVMDVLARQRHRGL